MESLFGHDISRPVAENDTVILMIHNKGGFTAHVERGKTVKICKDNFNLDALIGCSYGDVFTKEDGAWIKIRRNDPQYQQYRNRIRETISVESNIPSSDNRDVYDDNTAQKLSYDDIQRLKRERKAQEVIESIVDNSETFAKKSKMAQEKYISRKESRHIKLFYVRPCDLYNVCDCYFTSFPHKIGYLNFSNLAMMMYLASIKYNDKVMVLDHALGIITAAVCQRLAGSGRIYRLVAKGVSDKVVHEIGIRYFDNIFSLDMSEYIPLGITSVRPVRAPADTSNLPGDQECNISDQDEMNQKDANITGLLNNVYGQPFDESDAGGSKSFMESPREDLDSRDEKEVKRQKLSQIPGIYPLYNATKEEVMNCQVLIGNIAFNKCNKLNSMVSLYTRSFKAAADMYLEMGGRLVLYGQQYQPMAELQAELTLSEEYVNVKFDEVFCREYQMLPLRTHPVMTAELRPCCGFIVSATKTSKDILS
ncbi:initiation factor 3 gamma subunit containing protein [Babesia bovis T2Bo]|uniref:tRNA (adenine(58)-N(1))-methyltransferase non-catalytic subunit TRM6 n=1 Tax=Babesia bovis TaxID=5865 RepID=A7AS16_BABBO|nr:initiation factor 3 gamma subunit containing protein [Babesia bovis T2Bo]EDO07335.1 initiation factor 3 gamma subunit containing protein [Babesia bovis T2Bo]|eukprot:XP_001610903.1 initiation factor 3 gamma subunit containing protein [Babesia bovis T2Bo]